MARTKPKRKYAHDDGDDGPAPRPRGVKRKAEHVAIPAPARKRRVAADRGRDRVMAIVEAENEFAEEEIEREGASLQVSAIDESPVEADLAGLEAQGVMVEGAVPVVVPGFRLWETESKVMARGGETMLVSKIGKSKSAKTVYSRLLDIQYPEHFNLVPLTITHGPYSGRHIFMLEPEPAFTFMGLPAEIRTLIYSFVVGSDEHVKMTTAKRVYQPKRPVRSTYRTQRFHPGLKWDAGNQSWIDMPASVVTLFRLSKQVLEEAAPILYGNNYYHFNDFSDLRVFLDTIGSMRKYLRDIHIEAHGWERHKVRTTLESLSQATNLRTLSINHLNVCHTTVDYWIRWVTTPKGAATDLYYHLVRSLKDAQVEKDDDHNILDLIKIRWTRCPTCKKTAPGFADGETTCERTMYTRYGLPGCKTQCKNGAQHCRSVQAKIRKELARLLKIDDEEGGDGEDDETDAAMYEIVDASEV